MSLSAAALVSDAGDAAQDDCGGRADEYQKDCEEGCAGNAQACDKEFLLILEIVSTKNVVALTEYRGLIFYSDCRVFHWFDGDDWSGWGRCWSWIDFQC